MANSLTYEELERKLAQREKELNCLYGLSSIVEEHETSLNEILQEVPSLLSGCWQYQDITCARIFMGDELFTTHNFRATRWKQAADIIVGGKRAGKVEIYYLEKRPEQDEGPFLKEERRLLDAMAERLGWIVERKQLEEETKHQWKQFAAIIDNFADSLYVADPKTYEVLLVNKSLEKALGRNPVGGLCYREFQGLNAPCDFCTNDRILKDRKPYVWEHYNPLLDKDFLLTDQMIRWPDGREVRYEIATDITGRKQTEKELQRSNEVFEKILSTTHMAVAYLDRDFNFIRVNRAYAGADGHDEAFFAGKNHFDLYPHPENEAIFRRVVETGEPFTAIAKGFEYPEHPERGVTHWDWTLHPVKDNTGAVEGLLLCLLDVTERVRGVKALHETKRLLESTLASLADAVFVVEPSSRRIIACNPALERVFGYSEKEVVGRNTEFFHVNRNMYEKFGRELFHALDAKGIYHTEYKLRRKDGSVFFSENTVTAIVDDSGNRTGLVSFVRDITERKHAEEALKKLEEQRRYLSARLLEAQETERRYVANELHDSIGSSLAGIKMALELKLKAMQKGAGTSEAIDLETIIARAREVMENTKRIQKNLRPLVLDNLGLIPAIRSLCREFEQTHPDIAITPNLELNEEVSESMRIAIYRICQEALNNIARHSGARAASLSLTKRSSNIELVIGDEGHGFDIEEALKAGEVRQGIGLFSMRERCELAGGSFSLLSSTGEGTIVSACWPCT
jgi:PAS domain S-box-containing protein